MFNLALDCKLRACDFIKLKVSDIAHGKNIQSRAMLIQKKTGTPVQFELTKQTRVTLQKWISSIGLDITSYSTHSMRRTKATLIYKKTKNLRAVQILLGHMKLESTVRYLGIEVDDALELSETIDI